MIPDPAVLARHYSRFRVAERILLTGHSHQAWPDAGFAGQQRAWLDAAALIGDKWPRNLEEAQRVREGFARLLGDRPGNIALGQNTHELVIRWISALPIRQRPRVVTSDSEFRSLSRQLRRLAEEGLELVVVPARPVETLAERLAGALDARTAAAMVSSVLYDTAEVVPHLGHLAARCAQMGAELLVDAYHHLNVVPFDVAGMGLEHAFVTGGGYKYCQLGEGNCFLRVPPDCRMRPVITGWYAELERLDSADRPEGAAESVGYETGAGAFAGATYDPTSHYRAAAVFAFHREQGLDATTVHQVNRRQVALLKEAFERLDLDPRVARIDALPADARGGFLAIHTPHAAAAATELRKQDVSVDARGTILRAGPAPFVRDDQLLDGMSAIGAVLRAL